MSAILVVQVLLLISVANSVPLFAKRFLFKNSTLRPLDGGMRLADGQFLFGPTKTVWGLASSAVATSLTASAIGLGFVAGLIVSLGAMTGDLVSSFIKRRLRLPPSSRATGLDQIPESLCPCLLAATILPLTIADIAAILLVFVGGEIVLSRALYCVGLREQPY